MIGDFNKDSFKRGDIAKTLGEMYPKDESEKQDSMEVKKEIPSTAKQVGNFAKAALKHAKDGFSNVSFEQYLARLDVCKSCDLRLENRCTECGCYVDKKAWWQTEDCPKNKWPKIG